MVVHHLLRMKIKPFLSILLLVFTYSSVQSSSEYSSGYELVKEAPLQATLDEFHRLRLDKATGSSGPQTFSLLLNMEILEIRDSTISHISDGALCSPPKLKELSIYTNREFPPVDRQLFERCSKLEILTVTNIWTSPDIFWDLPKLRYLHILDSNFQYFTKDFLKPLTKLNGFVLEDCEMHQIDSDALCVSSTQRNLELINVNFHEPINKDIFENCNFIQNLYISYSQGYKAVEEDAFMNFSDLESLTLGHLMVQNLTRTFLSGLPNLVRANLDSNKIERIDFDAFEDTLNLQELSLSYNDIQNLNVQVFGNLQGLKVLKLRMTRLHTIGDIGYLPNLRELYLGYNHIDYISANEIEPKFRNLRILEIKGNPADNNETRASFRRLRDTDPYFYISLKP